MNPTPYATTRRIRFSILFATVGCVFIPVLLLCGHRVTTWIVVAVVAEVVLLGRFLIEKALPRLRPIQTRAQAFRWSAVAGAAVMIPNAWFFRFLTPEFFVWIPVGALLGATLGLAVWRDAEAGEMQPWEQRVTEVLEGTTYQISQRLMQPDKINTCLLLGSLPAVLAFFPRSLDLLFYVAVTGFLVGFFAIELWDEANRWIPDPKKRYIPIVITAVVAGLFIGLLFRKYRIRLFMPAVMHGLLATSAIFVAVAFRGRRSGASNPTS